VQFATQKARGIAALTGIRHWVPEWVGLPQGVTVMPHQIINHWSLPTFARPCPERPRHGFVESRRVSNVKELLEIFVEARIADPAAEVILMPQCTAKMSAVATDAGVTWGLGNDGVTAGGRQWDIPCPNGALTKRIHLWSGQYREDIKGGAFLEIVEDKGTPTIVQVRDGPVIAKATGNFIPEKDYRVTHVIYLPNYESSNLLEWERKIQEAPKGSVLVLADTGLSSHFAVHGIVHNLAVITGPRDDVTHKVPDPISGEIIRQPKVKVGDILQPDNGQPAKLRHKDYKAMRLMFRKGMPFARKEGAGFSTAVLHSMGSWGRERHLLALRVVGAVTMMRLLTAACVGEARHFHCRADRATAKPCVPWKTLMGYRLTANSDVEGDGDWDRHEDQGSGTHFAREQVFLKALAWPIAKLTRLANAAREDLSGAWGGCDAEDNRTKYDEKGEIIPVDMAVASQYQTGFGGPRWRVSAEVAVRLGKALEAFQKRPCEKTWAAVCARYNEGVNCAHNGGKLLDKFCDQSSIDLCAKVPQFGFISRMTYETIETFKDAPDHRKAARKPATTAIPESHVIAARKGSVIGHNSVGIAA